MNSVKIHVNKKAHIQLNKKHMDTSKQLNIESILFTSNKATTRGDSSLEKSNYKLKDSKQIKISHIGTDEIGINNYFGPICVVSCFVDKKDFLWLNEYDFSNVKNLTQSEIIKIAKVIKDRISYSLLILDNPHYNKMVSEGFNPANIKARLYNRAITNVMQKIKRPIQKKVIEQFVSPKTYYNYLKKEVIVVKDVEFDSEAHEKYIAVACAHILSRYASMQYFNNMTSKFKVKLPRGTNLLVDKVGTQLVTTYGDAILNKVAKKHFANTRKILELKNSKEA